MINKVRALCAWYSKELECGSQLPAPVNTADSLARLDEIIDEFFAAETAAAEGRVARPALQVREPIDWGCSDHPVTIAVWFVTDGIGTPRVTRAREEAMTVRAVPEPRLQ